MYWITMLNYYMQMMLIVDGEFIHANLDVIGDECMYLHIAVELLWTYAWLIESYVHASYVESDVISILPLTGNLYPYSRWL